MSLTSELKNRNSPASLFMRGHFPNTRRVMSLCRGMMGKDFQTCRPAERVPYPLIGTALDYRLRFYFPRTGRASFIQNLVCYAGAARACGGTIVHTSTGEIQCFTPPTEKRLERFEENALEANVLLDFFVNLEVLLRRLAPTQRRLEKADEDMLQRYCVVMAALEVFSRIGYDRHSILLAPEPKATLGELLAVAEDAWVHDLRTLSWNFYDKFTPLLFQPSCLNPTFDGSSFVGGADADIVVDGCLIDIKTTINPLKDTDWIYQILGYVLLDWHDENQIQEVAIYLSRQSFLLRWSLDDLLSELMGKPGSLAELRQQWHDTVAAPWFGEGAEESQELAEQLGYTKINGKWKPIPPL